MSLQLLLSYGRIIQRAPIWQHSRQFLGKHLLLVNTATASVLYATGDVLQQKIEGAKKFDWNRTLRMGTLGIFVGPVNHYWYKFLDATIKGATGKAVFKKVLADQLVMAPLFAGLFYVGMCTLERKGVEEMKAEVKTKFWPTYKTDWKLWPAAQTINFFFIPPSLRVTYVNVVTLIWTTYLSKMKHIKEKNSESSIAPPSISPAPPSVPLSPSPLTDRKS